MPSPRNIETTSLIPRSGVKVMNPAFDVTPHGLITAIITERGVARAPYTKSLARLLGADTRDVRRRVSR